MINNTKNLIKKFDDQKKTNHDINCKTLGIIQYSILTFAEFYKCSFDNKSCRMSNSFENHKYQRYQDIS